MSIVAGAQKRTNHSNHHCSALHHSTTPALSRTLRSELLDARIATIAAPLAHFTHKTTQNTRGRRSGSCCRHWTSSEYEQISGVPGPIHHFGVPREGREGVYATVLRRGVVQASPPTFSRVLITVGINFYPTVCSSSSHRAASIPWRKKKSEGG